MRLGLAGGVIVVLVVFAIVMLEPGSPRLGLRSGLNPPGAQLQDGSRVLIVNAALLSRGWDYWSGGHPVTYLIREATRNPAAKRARIIDLVGEFGVTKDMIRKAIRRQTFKWVS